MRKIHWFCAGGPTALDSHNVDMANQLDRSEGADVRGVKEHQSSTRGSGSSAVPRRSSQEVSSRIKLSLLVQHALASSIERLFCCLGRSLISPLHTHGESENFKYII